MITFDNPIIHFPLMENADMISLSKITLAPWIQKATALIGVSRRVGGNQFRHAMATMSIILDYKIVDPIILKASVIHDLLEDFPSVRKQELISIDSDGPQVVDLVLEVTKDPAESKEMYLQRIRDHGSRRAKILKSADRISNLVDLHLTIYDPEKYQRYINQTVTYILPMAMEVNRDMAHEIIDLINIRSRKLGLPEIRETA
jgi:GTP pyrophosphokinase